MYLPLANRDTNQSCLLINIEKFDTEIKGTTENVMESEGKRWLNLHLVDQSKSVDDSSKAEKYE